MRFDIHPSSSRCRLATLGLRGFCLLFAVSGFAGLIYESIWSHYLKLLLGHAAYAQIVVLAIFMGGMAIGAALASRWSRRIANLLAVYAAVECALGLAALGFHAGFVATSDWLHGVVAPALGAPLAVRMVIWSVAAALILPQSILLGMTFPTLTGGVLRRYPGAPGRTLAALYCCNSLGAVAGVLASGLWLVGTLGLPGTLCTAGLVNIGLAAAVGINARSREAGPHAAAASAAPSATQTRFYRRLLIVAAITGASSFVYEVCWIRMLSMVLGASTHSFELMLATFILGLALGGYWISGRIEHVDSLRALALAQLVMGVAALASLTAYGETFAAMHWLREAVPRSAHGYALHLAGSSVIVMLIMLPATFCAGMTLPLITHCLWRAGHGERAIGAVYAANTLGAICGIAFAINIGLPLLGLRNALACAASLDLVLGTLILWYLPAGRRRTAYVACLLSVAAVATTLAVVRLDPYQMAAGVYRYHAPRLSRRIDMQRHIDGKTATVNLFTTPRGRTVISTNGKPDASIDLKSAVPAPDEITMVLAAALPLALHPDARTAANIGMGSGLTTTALLGAPWLERVDTIEIEAAMVAAAQGFRPRVAPTYDDPRSHIHIEDAKTFFAAQQRRYDIIVSEPSNPWVSGIASLFSLEFYAHVKRFLTADGVFVQWLQIYETDLDIAASVFGALGAHFAHYVVYAADSGNVLIVARNGRPLGEPDAAPFKAPALAAELARIGVRNNAALALHRVAARATLEPMLDTRNVPANSDYFPYVDQRAARARFLGSDARALLHLARAPRSVIATPER